MNDPKAHRDTSGEELTRGTPGSAWSTATRLSAAQLHDDKDGPNWKAPHEKWGRSTAAVITIVIASDIVLLIVFRVVGIIQRARSAAAAAAGRPAVSRGWEHSPGSHAAPSTPAPACR